MATKKIVFLIIILLFISSGCYQSSEEISDVDSIEKAGSNLLVQQNNKISLYDESLEKQGSARAEGFLWQATSYNNSIIVGYGYSSEKPDSPIKVMRYDMKLENKDLVFKKNTPRNQISTLKSTKKGVLITYFTSKYHTKTILLNTMEVLDERRLGMYTDLGNKLLIGRPYGDDIDEEGDVILGNETLPSFRGVNAVEFVNISGNSGRDILIADGWHKNYGELAEPRLSLINHTNRNYKTIDVQQPQHSIRRINQIGDHIFTVGNLQATLYTLPDWNKTIIDNITNKNIEFDAVNLQNGYFAILKNKTVKIKHIDI